MRPTLQNLQALRGIACLLVVCYHVGSWEGYVWSKWRPFHAFRWFGYAGVDVFFVLSGFIITWAHLDHLGRAKKLPRYLARRLWRIYPVLWVSSVLGAALLGLFAGGDVFAAGWVANWVEWLLLVPRHEPSKFNPGTWSLYYEMMFYLAFGLLFLVPKRWAAVLGIAWAVGIVAAKFANVSPAAFWMYLPISPFVLEFLAGTLVAAVVTRGFVRWSRAALAVALIWLGVFVTLLHGPTPDDLGGRFWARVVAFGPPCALIVYAVVAGEITGRVRLPRRLQAVGDASYSIYLMHLPVGITIMVVTIGMNTNLPTHLLWVALLLSGCLGSGWLLHVLVERPLLNRAKAKPPAPGAAKETAVGLPLPFSPR
jgi:peptidoglycan/LPS O-acetylase OafA/YrhL